MLSLPPTFARAGDAAGKCRGLDERGVTPVAFLLAGRPANILSAALGTPCAEVLAATALVDAHFLREFPDMLRDPAAPLDMPAVFDQRFRDLLARRRAAGDFVEMSRRVLARLGLTDPTLRDLFCIDPALAAARGVDPAELRVFYEQLLALLATDAAQTAAVAKLASALVDMPDVAPTTPFPPNVFCFLTSHVHVGRVSATVAADANTLFAVAGGGVVFFGSARHTAVSRSCRGRLQPDGSEPFAPSVGDIVVFSSSFLRVARERVDAAPALVPIDMLFEWHEATAADAAMLPAAGVVLASGRAVTSLGVAVDIAADPRLAPGRTVLILSNAGPRHAAIPMPGRLDAPVRPLPGSASLGVCSFQLYAPLATRFTCVVHGDFPLAPATPLWALLGAPAGSPRAPALLPVHVVLPCTLKGVLDMASGSITDVEIGTDRITPSSKTAADMCLRAGGFLMRQGPPNNMSDGREPKMHVYFWAGADARDGQPPEAAVAIRRILLPHPVLGTLAPSREGGWAVVTHTGVSAGMPPAVLKVDVTTERALNLSPESSGRNALGPVRMIEVGQTATGVLVALNFVPVSTSPRGPAPAPALPIGSYMPFNRESRDAFSSAPLAGMPPGIQANAPAAGAPSIFSFSSSAAPFARGAMARDSSTSPRTRPNGFAAHNFSQFPAQYGSDQAFRRGPFAGGPNSGAGPVPTLRLSRMNASGRHSASASPRGPHALTSPSRLIGLREAQAGVFPQHIMRGVVRYHFPTLGIAFISFRDPTRHDGWNSSRVVWTNAPKDRTLIESPVSFTLAAHIIKGRGGLGARRVDGPAVKANAFEASDFSDPEGALVGDVYWQETRRDPPFDYGFMRLPSGSERYFSLREAKNILGCFVRVALPNYALLTRTSDVSHPNLCKIKEIIAHPAPETHWAAAHAGVLVSSAKESSVLESSMRSARSRENSALQFFGLRPVQGFLVVKNFQRTHTDVIFFRVVCPPFVERRIIDGSSSMLFALRSSSYYRPLDSVVQKVRSARLSSAEIEPQSHRHTRQLSCWFTDMCCPSVRYRGLFKRGDSARSTGFRAGDDFYKDAARYIFGGGDSLVLPPEQIPVEDRYFFNNATVYSFAVFFSWAPDSRFFTPRAVDIRLDAEHVFADPLEGTLLALAPDRRFADVAFIPDGCAVPEQRLREAALAHEPDATGQTPLLCASDALEALAQACMQHFREAARGPPASPSVHARELDAFFLALWSRKVRVRVTRAQACLVSAASYGLQQHTPRPYVWAQFATELAVDATQLGAA